MFPFLRVSRHLMAQHGVSVRRGTVYGLYLEHCHETQTPAVNMATFGKVMHSTFSNLKTRRLGKRNNTK